MRTRQWLIGLITIVAGLLVGAGALYAQGSYDLSWFSVDGGGAVSSAGVYTLRGVAGQADAGQLDAGTYTLIGGVLAAQDDAPITTNPKSTLFLPSLKH